MVMIFDYSELCFLLAEAGVNAPVGVGAVHFPPLTEAEKQDMLQAGQAKLSAREDGDGRTLVQVLAEPTAVLHATRVQAGKPDKDIWLFYTLSQTVLLQKTEAGRYTLTPVSGDTAVMDQLQLFLPLQPAPPELIYRVQLPEEDFLTLRDLASAWEEVPALEILEADGLEQVASRDLFDSAVEPEWRGIIECLSYQGQTITGLTTLSVLQGAEISWVIQPSTGGKLIVETARQGLFPQALAIIWDASLAR